MLIDFLMVMRNISNMTFNKAIGCFCLMLMIASQFLVAQHVSVHSLDEGRASITVLDHHNHTHSHDTHDSNHNGDCTTCDFIKIISHSLSSVGLLVALIVSLVYLNYRQSVIGTVGQRIKASSYYSQAPPWNLFLK